MPPRPLRIRPAARSRRVAPAPKPKARPKRKAKDSSANPPSPPGWIDVKKVAHDTFPLGSLLHLEVFYQDETGDMVGKLEETHQDTEGIWLGIAVKGTKLTGLRSWRLTHPGAHEYLYVCYQDTPVEKRLKIGSVAYLVRAKKIDSVPLDWGKNCEEGASPRIWKLLLQPTPRRTRENSRKRHHLRRPPRRKRRARRKGRRSGIWFRRQNGIVKEHL